MKKEGRKQECKNAEVRSLVLTFDCFSSLILTAGKCTE